MEAIYLVCGAGRPQLKRNPLGSSPHMAIARLLLILPALACAPYRTPLPIRDGIAPTLGCYLVVYGYWSPATSIPDSEWLKLTPPAFIQLHATGQASPRWPVAATSFGAKWHLFGNDSVVVAWEHNVLSIHLRPSANSLGGVARLSLPEEGRVVSASTAVRASHMKCP